MQLPQFGDVHVVVAPQHLCTRKNHEFMHRYGRHFYVEVVRIITTFVGHRIIIIFIEYYNIGLRIIILFNEYYNIGHIIVILFLECHWYSFIHLCKCIYGMHIQKDFPSTEQVVVNNSRCGLFNSTLQNTFDSDLHNKASYNWRCFETMRYSMFSMLSFHSWQVSSHTRRCDELLVTLYTLLLFFFNLFYFYYYYDQLFKLWHLTFVH